MKKILLTILFLLFTCNLVRADFEQHYNLAQQYLSQYQYSSAISEFKKALRINYLDNSARIGLVNSYLARGTYFANKDKNWENAANDYRAALFYLKYYPSEQDIQNSSSIIFNTMENLNQCLVMQKFNSSASSRYAKAKELRFQGLFAEAGYEFAQSVSDITLRKDAYEQLGDISRVLGNNQKASEYYKLAIDINSGNVGLRLKYARVLDNLGQNDIAVKEYNYVLSKGAEDPEILYALERIYRKKLEEFPNDSALITNLGAILQKENRLDEALKYYSQASQFDPSSVTTRLNVGTLYQQKKSYDAAIAAYDSILFLYPKNLQATLYRAQCLAAKGDKEQALEGFRNVLSIDPTNKEVKSEILNLRKESMSPAEFVSFMAGSAIDDKDALEDMYNYAIDLHKQNKFDDAILGYKEVLKLKTDNSEVYLNLAIAYRQKDDLSQAQQILQNAKTKFPDNQQISSQLKEIVENIAAVKFDDASNYYNNGDYQKALLAYQSIKPVSSDSLNGIALCYKALDNNTQAIEYYKKSLEISPNSDVAYYIGVIYSEQEDWNNSKNYLKKSLTINPNNEKAKDLYQTVIEQVNIKLVNNAIAFYDKADYQKALSILNQVLKDEPKNAYALYYKGLILDGGKKYLQAITEYKKALQANPDLTIIYYLMALDYDNLAQYKSSLANYKKYISLTAENNEYKTYSQSRIKELKKYEN
jgi:tetratricopeptide (TPR) repeat protein